MIAEVHSSGTHVQIIGYSPLPEKEIIVISETDEEDLPPPEITIESSPPTEEEPSPVPLDVPTPIVITPRTQSRRLFKRKRSQLEQDVDVLLDNLKNQETKPAKEMDEVSLPIIPEVFPSINKKLQFDMSPFRGLLPDAEGTSFASMTVAPFINRRMPEINISLKKLGTINSVFPVTVYVTGRNVMQ